MRFCRSADGKRLLQRGERGPQRTALAKDSISNHQQLEWGATDNHFTLYTQGIQDECGSLWAFLKQCLRLLHRLHAKLKCQRFSGRRCSPFLQWIWIIALLFYIVLCWEHFGTKSLIVQVLLRIRKWSEGFFLGIITFVKSENLENLTKKKVKLLIKHTNISVMLF